MADARLQLEQRDGGLTGLRQSRAAEEPDGQRVGLRVVGRDQREQRRLPRPVAPEDCPALPTADGPVQTIHLAVANLLLPIPKGGLIAISDAHAFHLDERLTSGGRRDDKRRRADSCYANIKEE